MAGDGGESREPIAAQETQLQHQQPTNDQLSQRRIVALVILLLGGGGAGGIAGLVARVVKPPHDIWAVACGVIFISVAVAVAAYEILRAWGRTIITLVCFLIAIVFIFADKWTQEVWMAQSVPPTQTVSNPTPNNSNPLPELVPPAFHEKIEDLFLTLGSLSFRAASQSPVFVTGMIPPSLYVEKGVLYMDVVVWSGSEAEPAVIVRRNEFEVKPFGWDRNSSTNALEIVDEKNEPVLQLIRLTPSNFRLAGIFPLHDGGWPPGSLFLVDDKQFTTYIPPRPFPSDFKLVPIFKYPSWKYPGEYANP